MHALYLTASLSLAIHCSVTRVIGIRSLPRFFLRPRAVRFVTKKTIGTVGYKMIFASVMRYICTRHFCMLQMIFLYLSRAVPPGAVCFVRKKQLVM
jgi:hypothetical protein